MQQHASLSEYPSLRNQPAFVILASNRFLNVCIGSKHAFVNAAARIPVWVPLVKTSTCSLYTLFTHPCLSSIAGDFLLSLRWNGQKKVCVMEWMVLFVMAHTLVWPEPYIYTPYLTVDLVFSAINAPEFAPKLTEQLTEELTDEWQKNDKRMHRRVTQE